MSATQSHTLWNDIEAGEDVVEGRFVRSWIGRHTRSGRPVRVTLLDVAPGETAGPQEHMEAAFRVAGQKAQGFSAEGVVSPMAAADYEGVPSVLTLLPRGTLLADLIRQEERFELYRIAEWGSALASALDLIYTAELHHGALCPENVWITEDNEPLLLEPEIHHAAGEAAQEAGLLCPPASPYGIESKSHIDPAVGDLFSLSRLLVVLMTGLAPQNVTSETVQNALPTEVPVALREELTQALGAARGGTPSSLRTFAGRLRFDALWLRSKATGDGSQISREIESDAPSVLTPLLQKRPSDREASASAEEAVPAAASPATPAAVEEARPETPAAVISSAMEAPAPTPEKVASVAVAERLTAAEPADNAVEDSSQLNPVVPASDLAAAIQDALADVPAGQSLVLSVGEKSLDLGSISASPQELARLLSGLTTDQSGELPQPIPKVEAPAPHVNTPVPTAAESPASSESPPVTEPAPAPAPDLPAATFEPEAAAAPTAASPVTEPTPASAPDLSAASAEAKVEAPAVETVILPVTEPAPASAPDLAAATFGPEDRTASAEIESPPTVESGAANTAPTVDDSAPEATSLPVFEASGEASVPDRQDEDHSWLDEAVAVAMVSGVDHQQTSPQESPEQELTAGAGAESAPVAPDEAEAPAPIEQEAPRRSDSVWLAVGVSPSPEPAPAPVAAATKDAGPSADAPEPAGAVVADGAAVEESTAVGQADAIGSSARLDQPAEAATSAEALDLEPPSVDEATPVASAPEFELEPKVETVPPPAVTDAAEADMSQPGEADAGQVRRAPEIDVPPLVTFMLQPGADAEPVVAPADTIGAEAEGGETAPSSVAEPKEPVEVVNPLSPWLLWGVLSICTILAGTGIGLAAFLARADLYVGP